MALAHGAYYHNKEWVFNLPYHMLNLVAYFLLMHWL